MTNKQQVDFRKPVGKCCFHIGMPKTATKTLQMQLFANHSEVDFLGTYTGNKERFSQCRDAEIEELFTELLWANRDNPNFPRCGELYEKSVAPAFAAGLVPVWSWESLMEDRHEIQRKRAENLKAVFGDCKVIVGLRHPMRLTESLYLQLTKRDNIGRRACFRRGAFYLPIDKWLAKNWERPGRAPTAHLEYAETVEVFAEVFGKEAVGVFLFEQLVENPSEFVESICRFIGVDPQEGVRLSQGKRENDRWSQKQFDQLKRIKRSFFLSTVFRFANRNKRRQMLGIPRDGNQESPKARAEIPNRWQQQIIQKTAAGNRRLVERWNLPLDRYQYPL